MRSHAGMAALLALACLAGVPADALGEPRPDADQVGRALREVYAARVRAELDLTDEQAEVVLPLIEDIERARRESRREQRAARLELRSAVRNGADDPTIERLLERIDVAQRTEWRTVRDLIARVDRELSPRQRAQWRELNVRFREEVERRMRGPRGPAAAPGRRR